nr:MAG: Thymopoietin protein [Bacteriophage sp.]
MRKIRVTVGTVGYYDAKHAHKRMTAADGPFECEDTQAEHFVSAGVAEYVGGVIEADEADEQEVTGHLAKSQLEEMTIQQLQNLAGDLGVDVTGCKKKADYVDAIAATEVNAGGMVDDEDTDGDALPDLNAADPE